MASEFSFDLAIIAGLAVLGVVIYEKSKAPLTAAATAVGNTAVNAATGGLTDNQKQAMIDQETRQLIQAGADPAAAKAQATSDVTAALAGEPSYLQTVAPAIGSGIDVFLPGAF